MGIRREWRQSGETDKHCLISNYRNILQRCDSDIFVWYVWLFMYVYLYFMYVLQCVVYMLCVSAYMSTWGLPVLDFKYDTAIYYMTGHYNLSKMSDKQLLKVASYTNLDLIAFLNIGCFLNSCYTQADLSQITIWV